jgi:ATP-binding cassette, subfamily B, bacterial PglK
MLGANSEGAIAEKPRRNVSVLRKCVRLVGPGRWGRWVGLLVLAVVVSVLEAVGALAIYLLMTIITLPTGPLDVPLVGDLRVALPSVPHDTMVVYAAVGLGVFFVVRGVVIVSGAYLQGRIVFNAGARLGVRLLRGYLGMPYQFHLQRNSAELIRNAFDTVQVLVREVLLPVARVASEALVVIGIVVVLMLTAPIATILALAVLAPSVGLMLGILHPRLKRLGAVSQEMSSRSLQSLAQSLEGVRDIKILGREDAFRREFAGQRRAHARANYRRNGAREIPRIALETLLILFILVFFVVAERIGDGSQASLPVLGLFAYAALRLKPPLGTIMAGLNNVRFAATAIDQLYEDLVLVERDSRLVRPNVEALGFSDAIEVVDVSFGYESGHGPVLHDINVTIPRGSFVGIVGPTGGGKSTLVDIILGLLEPTTGMVLVDGVDVHRNVDAWQESLGVVPQSVFLIDATLRRNICLGFTDDEIDEERLHEAVHLAQLDSFVESLPEGMDTWVGERGVRVSGGQRQRIAIARALYRRPSVVVFDEGTSALDSLTEADLIRELDELRGDRTIITIAHRLTTVRSCDKILFLDDGRVTDQGTFHELVQRNPRFRAMAEPA